jgi:multidrug resistance efflux pump
MIGMSALRRVRGPRNARWVAGGLLAALAVLTVLLALVPWQQTSLGQGRVIPLDPASRTQSVEAPISGRVVQWRVTEGDQVQAGDAIAVLQDNDPSYLDRLEKELATVDDRLASGRAAMAAYEAKVDAVAAARDAAVTAAEAKINAAARKVDAARQKARIAQADFETAELNLARVEPLFRDGLSSQRTLELTRLKARETQAKRLEAQAGVAQATADLAVARAELVEKREDQRGKLEGVKAELEAASQKVAELEAKRLETETKLSRQGAQIVTSPGDGTVLAIVAGLGGEQVKAGDVLARVVPTHVETMVELTVDGNDVPLIERGQPVRLQFEGWPAVQFAGWPSVAVGTFPGEIAFVDAADDGSGRFRIVVREPEVSDEPWPDPRYLRQGLRAKGWVVLSRVPLGWELWRQLNGFPPTVDPPQEGKAPLDGPKMPKALVPKDK